MKRLIIFVCIGVLGMGIYFYRTQVAYPDVSRVRYTLIDGRHIEMQAFKGRPLIVSFWATSCVSCIKEIPELIKLYGKYSAKGLEIIGVAMPYDRPDHVLEFVKTHNLPYPIALDIDANIVRAFGNIKVTPNNFLIDPDGGIHSQHVGILDFRKTEQWLQSAIHNLKH